MEVCVEKKPTRGTSILKSKIDLVILTTVPVTSDILSFDRSSRVFDRIPLFGETDDSQ